METSPSETDDERERTRTDPIRSLQLHVEPAADPETVAAIAGALRTHWEATTRKEEPEAGATWHGRAWGFAGRYERMTNRRVRPAHPLPTDAWRAADRLDRQ